MNHGEHDLFEGRVGAALWARVEAHLDARRDPFRDPALAAELRAAPQLERAARRLVGRLDALSSAPSPRRAARARVLLPALAVAAALAVALARRLNGPDSADVTPPRDVAAVEVSAGGARPITPAEALASDVALGVVHSASIDIAHVLPPPPRTTTVVHESHRVFGWTTSPYSTPSTR